MSFHYLRGKFDLFIGHINLSESFNGAGEYFVRLIEALQSRGSQQYVLVRNIALAKRLDLVEGVTVGPVVRSAVTAYCLVPHVNIVHIHDRPSWPAGLLLTLTRTIPYVLTRHVCIDKVKNPLNQAVIDRAAGFIDENQIDASEHLVVYERALEVSQTRATNV